MKGTRLIVQAGRVETHLVDGDEAFGVHVDAALLQETRRRNASCGTETGNHTGRNSITESLFLLFF